MNKTQEERNSSQDTKNDANSLFKWAFGTLLGILFTLVGILYGYLKTSDVEADISIKELQQHQSSDALRFQNLENNVYLLCKAQKLDCLPPAK